MPHSAFSYAGQEKPTKLTAPKASPSWLLPALGIAAGIGGTIYSARAAKEEAEKNRKFQAEMSNTAHQREVRDLMASGLNPLLSANSGASSPSGSMADLPDFGDAISRHTAAALAVRAAESNIELTQAQAAKLRVETGSIETLFPAHSRLADAQASVAERNFEQMGELFPLTLEKTRAEIRQHLSSARAAQAAAVLDELSRSGAVNEEQFQRLIGQAGPWGRVLASMVKLGAVGAGAGAVLKRGKAAAAAAGKAPALGRGLLRRR